MPHTKQVTLIFLLLLFLQAFQLCTSKGTTPSTLIPLQVTDKMFPLDEPIKGKADGVPELDAIPEFHTGLTLNTDCEYDSGYESDLDTHSSDRIAKKRHMGAKSGYDAKDIETMFKNWIQSMRKAADEQRGIKWELSGDELKRPIGPNSGNGNLYAGEDYGVIALNIYRAAYMIFKLYKIDENELVASANKLMEYYSNNDKQKIKWIDTIKTINIDIVRYLKSKVFPDESLDWINANLRLAENYVGLDDTHYNITTTFTIGDKNFALEDKKWLPLTAEQKKGYINRKSEKWYDRLKPFEQKLIDHYWPKIVDGNHYIPTQLRSILGCRNAYQKRILAYDAHNNPIVLGRYYHSGSFVSPIKWKDKEDQEIDFEISKDNWAQVLEKITQQDETIEPVCLNYAVDIPYFKQCQEKKIVTDSEKIVGPGLLMNISINEISTLLNVNPKISELIREILLFYKERYPNLCKAFEEEEEEKDKKDKKNKTLIQTMWKRITNHRTKYITKEIEEVGDPKVKSLFQEVLALSKVIGSDFGNTIKHTISITNNRNANIGASYIACKATSGEDQRSIRKVLIFCKSGKDRTGVMSSLIDTKILEIRYPGLAKSSNIYKTLAYSGHYQFLASVNGGMPGRFGMKPVKGNQQVADSREVLFPRTATWTNIDPTKEYSKEYNNGLYKAQIITEKNSSTNMPAAG